LDNAFCFVNSNYWDLYFSGKEINGGRSLEIIKERGVVFGENNIFLFEFNDGAKLMKKEIISYLLFIVELAIEISMFLYYVFNFYRNKFYTLFKFIVISLIWMIPLYILGIDWYRWNHVYSMLLFVIVVSLLPIMKITGFLLIKILFLKDFLFLILFFLSFCSFIYNMMREDFHYKA
jgi:hypothetical protein